MEDQIIRWSSSLYIAAISFSVGNSIEVLLKESSLLLIYKFKRSVKCERKNGYKNTRTYAEGVEKSQTIQCLSA